MGCNPSKDGGGGGGEGTANADADVPPKTSAPTATGNAAETFFIPLSDDDFEGRNNSSGSTTGKEDGSRTMKTSEETADFEKEFRPDDVELCHAATKIQASFRGHMTRKQQAGGKDEPGGAGASGSKTDGIETQLKNVDINKDADLDQLLDVDLADPELHKAATKIQASFRGHKARKTDDAVGTKQ